MFLFGLQPEEFKNLIISVGSHKGLRPLSPVEVASLLDRMRQAGSSPKDIAAALHLEGPSMIARFVRLLGLHQDVLHLVDWGQSDVTIGFTSASDLSRIPPDEQPLACAASLENQFSKTEVQQLVQRLLRSKRTVQDCIADTLKLRPTVEKHYLFIGLITSDRTKEHLRTLSQNERDQLLSEVLTQVFPIGTSTGARLGSARFTLSSPHELPEPQGAQDLEASINSLIDKRLA